MKKNICVLVYAIALLIALLNVDSENVRQLVTVIVTMWISYMTGMFEAKFIEEDEAD